MPRSTHSSHARRLAVAFGFGLLLAFVPIPGVRFITESVGATESLPGTRPMSAQELAQAQAGADEPLGEGRVVGSDENVDEFTAIGFTFDTPPSEPVMVRVKGGSGDFGPWQELATEDDEGPDRQSAEAGRSGTAPLWVGTGTGYEVSVGAQDGSSVDVVTVHDEVRRTVVEATPRPALPFRPRSASTCGRHGRPGLRPAPATAPP